MGMNIWLEKHYREELVDALHAYFKNIAADCQTASEAIAAVSADHLNLEAIFLLSKAGPETKQEMWDRFQQFLSEKLATI